MWRSAAMPFAQGRRPAHWAACLAAAMATAGAADAGFQCARLVASTSRQPAYGPVRGEARCEGFYQKNVSQPFLELVSLTRSVPGTDPSEAAAGRLALRGLPRRDTRLVIQPLRSNVLYRVDAPLAGGATLQWASQGMLQDTGLRLRDLGFLAQAGNDGDAPAFAPVSLQASDTQATAYAVLRPSVDVTVIQWRGYRAGAPAPEWQTLTKDALPAWTRIVLPLPLPEDGHGLRVDVLGTDRRQQPLPLLQFVVLGVRDEAP